jgi:hypothetical protein
MYLETKNDVISGHLLVIICQCIRRTVKIIFPIVTNNGLPFIDKTIDLSTNHSSLKST